jgi:hypothetical protein
VDYNARVSAAETSAKKTGGTDMGASALAHASADDVQRGIESLPSLVNDDAVLVRRGRLLTTTFLVVVDDVEYLVRVVEGRIAALERGPFLMRPWSFAVRAAAETWRRFWAPVPAPGYHDLFAMKKLGVARIEGDILPMMTHLRYVKDVLAAPGRGSRS